MNDLRKAAEMALGALEEYTCVVQSGTDPNKWHEVVDGGAPARQAIEALRQALAEPEWVELTDDEGAEIWGDAHDIEWKRLVTPKEIVQRISDKLKEKNT